MHEARCFLMSVIINSRTGQRGDYAAWVSAFAELWRSGRSRSLEFMNLLSPDIKLTAPGLRSTHGRAEGEAAFNRTFRVLPDLTAQVERWSATGEVLFIEMTFSATIGGKRVTWRNVDRFLFQAGMAVERVAFFNPGPVRAAFLAGPSGWLQLWRRVRSGL
jgi:hypothetical protein